MTQTIVYTKTDESPMMSTVSLFPIFQSFLSKAGVEVKLSDISLAGRILSRFPEYVSEEQRVEDALSNLGKLVQQPNANVMKLPNISASIPQIHACIAELQVKGYTVPNYPEEPQNDEETEIKARYDRIKGSAVNPVLREGNSDRRAPKAVKKYAQANPHEMGAWAKDSKSHVAHMTDGDFFGSEKALTMDRDDVLTIEHVDEHGNTSILKDSVSVLAGEILDTSAMSLFALKGFLKEAVSDAKVQDVLFSIHLKATMMKVSDPIIFGAVVEAYYATVFEKYADVFETLSINPNNGMRTVERKIEALSPELQAAIHTDIRAVYENQPLACPNADINVTNLHVPSDVIIDASMAAKLRYSGQMLCSDGAYKDTKFTIPDRSYAGIYQEVIDFCKEHGAFDVTTMGSVSNVGLMAQKAQEYGSHDKTFQVAASGTVNVVDAHGNVLTSHSVEKGDIWRMCQVKDAPIADWVGLAVRRASATGNPVVFWLNSERASDVEMMRKVEQYLPSHNTEGLEIYMLSPEAAMNFTLERCKDGLDTISATGNVLRDYLTDLFPIFELGTSAKMLSVVSLMNGGGLFETGAGGTAPVLVQQILKENHLSWDSLGEFLAMEAALEHLSTSMSNTQAMVLSECLGRAIEDVLMKGKSPTPALHTIDNRGSHFYLAMYWSQKMAVQTQDVELARIFKPLAEKLTSAESQIVSDLDAVQGSTVDLQGYFFPTDEVVTSIMRPSTTFNQILADFAG
jgi:isocitrate dehydrogenase